MHLFTRSIGLLTAALFASFVFAGAASALTVTVTPSPSAITGTGTTPWQLTIQPSGGGPTVFTCVNAGFTATVRSATGAGPLAIATNYQQTFSSCRVAGISYTDTCSGTAVLSVTGVTVSGVTPLTLSSLSCTATIGGCGSARITGTIPETYNNTTRQLTVLTTGQALTVSGTTCSRIPNGAATFAATGGGNFVYAVSPATTIVAT
ncbi:hypothetical protein [Conexibacter woesei]|uniref:hypothetical protein n=1 Tax=Conexibacter woesei TaxID=191495 RepID=UPI0003F8D510|nr:hypothetical protein [Conexibacter woesei]